MSRTTEADEAAGADDRALLDLLHATADAVAVALGATDDWSPVAEGAAQHRSDLTADRAALDVLLPAGVGVLSEESGRSEPNRPVTVVVDPLDGSTNAARKISWYATSLCAVDGDGPRVALVADLRHGTRFTAVRGRGAWSDGRSLAPSGCRSLAAAVVGVNGLPGRHLGWAQFRALGAAALDLCAVAAGHLDGFVDVDDDALGPWDYLGGLLVCREAGAVVGDAHGRELVVLDHATRRRPWAAATSDLAAELQAALAADR